MNRTEQESLAQGKAKDGSELEFRFQHMDCYKAIIMAKIAHFMKIRLIPKYKIDDDAEAERAYRFYGGVK